MKIQWELTIHEKGNYHQWLKIVDKKKFKSHQSFKPSQLFNRE